MFASVYFMGDSGNNFILLLRVMDISPRHEYFSYLFIYFIHHNNNNNS
eukprot:gene47-25_t